jgi:hypothetical protein
VITPGNRCGPPNEKRSHHFAALHTRINPTNPRNQTCGRHTSDDRKPRALTPKTSDGVSPIFAPHTSDQVTVPENRTVNFGYHHGLGLRLTL